jgi:hypothetical protein
VAPDSPPALTPDSIPGSIKFVEAYVSQYASKAS